MLNLANVNFFYSNKRQAITDLSLEIAAGEFLAIVGRNGSGKTTLTKLCMSLIKPSSGSITFRGQDVIRLTPADMARSIGYVFQNPDRQIFRDTVEQEVAYGPQQLSFCPEKAKLAVNRALELTGLEKLRYAYPRELGKSFRQRVAIASALAMEPEVLILDEPTSGQDNESSQVLMNFLKELNNNGCTIILITHSMELLAKYCKRAIVMDEGQKVFDGQVDLLFEQADKLTLWGLREPSAIFISRRLAPWNIACTTEIEKLSDALCQELGGDLHA